MGTFRIPSLTQSWNILVAVFREQFPDRAASAKRSYHSRRLKFLAMAVTQLHSHFKTALEDAIPSTAREGDPINTWGGIRLGANSRKTATPARKSAAGRITGAAGATVVAGTALEDVATRLRFKVNQSVTIPVGESFDADIAAIDVGSKTRLKVGSVLRFVGSPPVGINGQVKLVKELDEDGFDAEQFGSYRKRILDSFAKETSGGTNADFVRWMLEINDIAKAFAYGKRAGIGTEDLVGLHTGTGPARILDLAEREELLAHVKSKVPTQVTEALRVLEVIADPQDIEVTISPVNEPAYAFDWAGDPLEVVSWDGPTRALELDVRPAGMKAGHRVILKGVASVQDGRQYKIEALSGAASIILETAPAIDPAATDIVYSGGPLVDPIRNALLGHVNGEDVYAGRDQVPYAESAIASVVGLSLLVEGMGPANPGGKYGAHAGGLIRAQLGQIVGFKRGVRNYLIVAPASDYEAIDDAFPNDHQIHMVTARSVIVRKA